MCSEHFSKWDAGRDYTILQGTGKFSDAAQRDFWRFALEGLHFVAFFTEVSRKIAGEMLEMTKQMGKSQPLTIEELR